MTLKIRVLTPDNLPEEDLDLLNEPWYTENVGEVLTVTNHSEQYERYEVEENDYLWSEDWVEVVEEGQKMNKLTSKMADYVQALGEGTVEPHDYDQGVCRSFYLEFERSLCFVINWIECCEDWWDTEDVKEDSLLYDYNFPIPWDEAWPMWSGKQGEVRKRFCLHVAEWMRKDLEGAK
jgi:hypothetical protein